MTENGSSRQPLGPAHSELGRRLREFRKRHGRNNLRRFAAELGVGAATLSEAENGVSTPSEEFVLRIVSRLGGDKAYFRRLHAAAVREQRALRAKRKKVREGEVQEDNSDQLQPAYPTVEIVQPDGRSVEVEPEDVSAEDINLSGPFVIEQLEEHHVVNAHRVIERTMYTRVLRATEPGFQIFAYAFDEDPDAVMARIVFSVRSPAEITRVLRRAKNGYVFLIKLPAALDRDECFTLRFSLTSFGAESFEETGLILKQQMVHTERVLLSVEFRTDDHPIQVGWFLMSYPIISGPVEELTLDDDKVLSQPPSGIYEKEFVNPMQSGQLVGIGWRFAE